MNARSTETTHRVPAGGPTNPDPLEGTEMSITDANPLARTSDPATSHAAAPARERRELQKRAILTLLTDVGPMTDHELTYQYQQRRAAEGWPATQADGVRKRRGELKNEGRVFDTGRTSGFTLGHAPSIIWAVTA